MAKVGPSGANYTAGPSSAASGGLRQPTAGHAHPEYQPEDDQSCWISVLGTTGVTAYVGIHDVGRVDTTVLVSAATAPSAAWRSSSPRPQGAHVVAIAGGSVATDHAEAAARCRRRRRLQRPRLPGASAAARGRGHRHFPRQRRRPPAHACAVRDEEPRQRRAVRVGQQLRSPGRSQRRAPTSPTRCSSGSPCMATSSANTTRSGCSDPSGTRGGAARRAPADGGQRVRGTRARARGPRDGLRPRLALYRQAGRPDLAGVGLGAIPARATPGRTSPQP